MSDAAPYSSSPVFTEETLPDALKTKHCTKRGVWGVIRVTRGKLALHFEDNREEQMLSPGVFGVLPPDELHWVAATGPFTMQIDFYRERPPMADLK